MEKVKTETNPVSDDATLPKHTSEEWKVDYELHLLPKSVPVELLLSLLNKGKLHQKIDGQETKLDRLSSNEKFTVFEKVDT